MSYNFLFWIVRGIANTSTRNVLKRLINFHNVVFLAIMEPLVPPDPMMLYSRILGMDFKGANQNGKIWVFTVRGASFSISDDSEQILHGAPYSLSDAFAGAHYHGLCKVL
ncbi:hypothetical protein AAHA92_31524 [Salvia divinorum]|uniref:Uncharacterized protein n=1 Tax=Salvia divinorum TaxID=28513 RepID=A0ABD1FHC7_SALDI